MSPSSEPSFWSHCLAAFREQLTPQQFNMWIRPLSVEAVDGGYRVLAPNRFVLQWVRERFLGHIARLAEQAEGRPVPISLHVADPSQDASGARGPVRAAGPAASDAPHPAPADARPDEATPLSSGESLDGADHAPKPGRSPPPAHPRGSGSSPSVPARAPSPSGPGATGGADALPRAAGVAPSVGHARRREQTSLNPAFTFATFVSGKANQLARAAGEQVADNPTAYNPLFVYGGVGLGKTHLVQAIGNRIQQGAPHARIRYIHAETYVSDVVRAYQHKAFDDFKRYYRSLDLLLVDDIQFFAGKSRTQEEFFYLFNTLIEAHKQVVITSDKFPKELPGIEERLISRFNWGLTAALEPPELEMRVAILLSKASASGLRLDESTAFFIAKHIRSNVRELEGALKRVMAYSNFHGQEVTLAVAKEALRDVLAVQNRQVSVENIQKTVADYYKIRVTDMHSKKRSRAIARPRQVAMALAKELTQLSLPEIGSNFGGRDHTTVLHACRTIAKLRETSAELNYEVNFLLQVLRS